MSMLFISKFGSSQLHAPATYPWRRSLWSPMNGKLCGLHRAFLAFFF